MDRDMEVCRLSARLGPLRRSGLGLWAWPAAAGTAGPAAGSDYWDEVFTPDGLDGHAALDDQSAFSATG